MSRYLLSLVLLLPFLGGCSRVSHMYYTDPELPFDHKTKYFIFQDSLYYEPTKARSIAKKRVLVDVLDPEKTIGGRKRITGDRETFTAFMDDFEKTLTTQLWRTGVFSDVARPGDERPLTDPDVKLNVAITEWHEGYAPLRWALRAVGKTRVQVEGEFVNAKTGEVYAAFADARIHPGKGLISPKTWMGRWLIAEDLAGFVKSFQKQVLVMTGTPEPPRGYHPVPRTRPYRETAEQAAKPPVKIPMVHLQEIVE